MSQKEILYKGTIKDIVPASDLGAHGDQMVAITEHPWHDKTADAWINVPDEGDFKTGDEVVLFRTRPRPNLEVISFEPSANTQ